MFGSVNAKLTFEFYLLRTEVDEEAIVDSCCRQVVDELHLMDLLQCLHRFQFQNQSLLDDDISFVVTDANAIIKNAERHFRFTFDSMLPDFYQ